MGFENGMCLKDDDVQDVIQLAFAMGSPPLQGLRAHWRIIKESFLWLEPAARALLR